MKHFSTTSSRFILVLALILMMTLTTRAEVHYEMVEQWGLVFELHIDEENPDNSEAVLMARSVDQPLDNEVLGYGPDSILYIPSLFQDEYHYLPVTEIMSCAFGGCDELKTVYIPASIKTIGERAFAGSSVETVYFMRDYNEESTEPITIGQEAFRECNRLDAVQFERPIDEFSPYLFMSCPNLVEIMFDYDATVRKIGTCALANCVNLTWMQVPYGLEVIGNGAFANCYNLQRFSFPESVTRIGDYAFAECGQLRYASLPSSLSAIGSHAFLNCSTLTQIVIPSRVVSIKDYAFACCRSLTNLRLHNNLQSIGDFAFAGCASLPGIDLPSSLMTIGRDAFMCGEIHCNIWSSKNLTDSTQLGISIYQYAYDIMDGHFDHINIGSNVTAIGDQAFAGHAPSTVVCMAPNPPTISYDSQHERTFSLDAYANAVLRVPRVLVNCYRNAVGWKRFDNIEGIEIMGNGDVDNDGSLTINDVTTIIDFLLSKQDSGINLVNSDLDGDGVVSINDVTNMIDALLNGNL